MNCYLLTIILKLKKMSAQQGKTMPKPHSLPAKKGLIKASLNSCSGCLLWFVVALGCQNLLVMVVDFFLGACY